MNKNVVSGIMILMVVLLIGCLDYKAYDIPKGEPSGAAVSGAGADSLVDEIAAIEKQIDQEQEQSPTGAVTEEVPAQEVTEEVPEITEEVAVEEEVVLPDLNKVLGEVPVGESLDVVSVKENEMIRVHVKVNDPDNDKVTYSFSSPLNSNGEWKTSYGDAGEYTSTITATDGKLTTTKKIQIVVERVNVPPVITGIKNMAAREGETVTFTPQVSDPNKDKVTVTVSEPLRTGTFKTDHTSAGEYQITVVVSDGELETEQSFTLNIADVNVLPEITNLPEKLTIKEGEVVEIKPVVTDLDEDDLTISISEPVGNSGVWETGYTDHGNYVITVSISDGKDTVIKKVNVQVDDVNMPPEIVDVYLG